MKQYYGNYLGLCINNDDKQKRGRVQIFIPHIMPALYENWNEVGEDIQMLCVGDNLPNSLTSDMVNKLTKMLPWAEAASPIIGTSAPGNLVNGNYDQSPVPVVAGGGELQGTTGGTNGDWAGSLPKLLSLLPPGSWNPSSQKRGRRSTRSGFTSDHYIGNTNAYAIDLGLNSSFGGNSAAATTTALQIVNNTQAQLGLPAYTSWSQISNGNYVATTPDGFRVQVIWQSNVGGNHYDHIHFGVKNTSGGRPDLGSPDFGPPPTIDEQQDIERTSTSGQVAGTPLVNPTPISLDPRSTDYATLGRPEVSLDAPIALNLDGSPASAAATVISKLAQDRQQYFANEINNPAILQRLSYLAWQEVDRVGSSNAASGTNVAQQTAWIETVVNRAYFSGRNLSSILNESAYGFRPGTSSINPTTQTAFNRVMGGSNITNLATDNASNVPGNPVADNRIAAGVTGAWYKNGRQVPYGTRGAEFLYRADGSGGYSSTAGLNAGKYAASNGIEGTVTEGPAQLVNHPDPNGPTAVVNINNMAKGMFSYPNPGALLWVFFREGDPNFPVYFAASFGASEWQSAYRQGSDVEGYKPAATPDSPNTSTGGGFNVGTGGLKWGDTTVPGDPTKDQKTLTIYGYDGSNMHFNEGYHQIFTKFDRRDQVEGDRWETTLGYKGRWVQGDDDKVVMGNVYVKIGNVSQTAVDAVNRIQEIIGEIMQPLAGDTTTT